MKRTFIMVLDSFGIGAAHDAADFGDTGADTLGHIAQACARGEADKGRKGPLHLPNLSRLGLGKAAEESTGHFPEGLDKNAEIIGAYGYARNYLPVKIPRPATGKLPGCRFCLTGAISAIMKTASRRNYWISSLNAPICQDTSATATHPVL